MVTNPDCGCDQCRYQRAREGLGISGSSPAIICFQDSPNRPQYIVPNLHTDWLLTHGWQWAPCGRMLQEDSSGNREV